MKATILLILVLSLSSNAFGQNSFEGRMYLREGLPFSWFKLDVNSKGFYYSVGDVGHQELSKNKLKWKQQNDSTLVIELDFWDKGEKLILYQNKERDYLIDKERENVFHRWKEIEFQGQIFKE